MSKFGKIQVFLFFSRNKYSNLQVGRGNTVSFWRKTKGRALTKLWGPGREIHVTLPWGGRVGISELRLG